MRIPGGPVQLGRAGRIRGVDAKAGSPLATAVELREPVQQKRTAQAAPAPGLPDADRADPAQPEALRARLGRRHLITLAHEKAECRIEGLLSKDVPLPVLEGAFGASPLLGERLFDDLVQQPLFPLGECGDREADRPDRLRNGRVEVDHHAIEVAHEIVAVRLHQRSCRNVPGHDRRAQSRGAPLPRSLFRPGEQEASKTTTAPVGMDKTLQLELVPKLQEPDGSQRPLVRETD